MPRDRIWLRTLAFHPLHTPCPSAGERLKRYGYYDVGDLATNLINTIYYGKDGKTSGKETYTYDGMGNIVSVSRDGKQKKAYTYDALNRIISEKDIDKELRESLTVPGKLW